VQIELEITNYYSIVRFTRDYFFNDASNVSRTFRFFLYLKYNLSTIFKFLNWKHGIILSDRVIQAANDVAIIIYY